MKDSRIIGLGTQKGMAEIMSEVQERADDEIKAVPNLTAIYHFDSMRFSGLNPDPTTVARIYKENMNPPGLISIYEQNLNQRNQGK